MPTDTAVSAIWSGVDCAKRAITMLCAVAFACGGGVKSEEIILTLR
jgi:hypothetical protein